MSELIKEVTVRYYHREVPEPCVVLNNPPDYDETNRHKRDPLEPAMGWHRVPFSRMLWHWREIEFGKAELWTETDWMSVGWIVHEHPTKADVARDRIRAPWIPQIQTDKGLKTVYSYSTWMNFDSHIPLAWHFENAGNIYQAQFKVDFIEREIMPHLPEFELLPKAPDRFRSFPQLVFKKELMRRVVWKDRIYQNAYTKKDGVPTLWAGYILTAPHKDSRPTQEWLGAYWPSRETVEAEQNRVIQTGDKPLCIANMTSLKRHFPDHPTTQLFITKYPDFR